MFTWNSTTGDQFWYALEVFDDEGVYAVLWDLKTCDNETLMKTCVIIIKLNDLYINDSYVGL